MTCYTLTLLCTTGPGLAFNSTAAAVQKSSLISALVSFLICLCIFAALRLFSEWFKNSQMNTFFGGFISSGMFVFGLTAVSNVEMLIFGTDFQAKFIPEIVFCLALAAGAAGMVHRVAVTTCILFSVVALYFLNLISTKYHNRTMNTEPAPRRGGGKKNK